MSDETTSGAGPSDEAEVPEDLGGDVGAARAQVRYDVALPKELAEKGLAINRTDPLFQMAEGWARENRVEPAVFNGLVGQFARHMHREADINRSVEIRRLADDWGVDYDEKMDILGNFMDELAGNDAEHAALVRLCQTAAGVRLLDRWRDAAVTKANNGDSTPMDKGITTKPDPLLSMDAEKKGYIDGLLRDPRYHAGDAWYRSQVRREIERLYPNQR